MIKVLFICHGNICRSPMAEFILKDMVSTRGIADQAGLPGAFGSPGLLTLLERPSVSPETDGFCLVWSAFSCIHALFLL